MIAWDQIVSPLCRKSWKFYLPSKVCTRQIDLFCDACQRTVFRKSRGKFIHTPLDMLSETWLSNYTTFPSTSFFCYPALLLQEEYGSSQGLEREWIGANMQELRERLRRPPIRLS